MNLERNLEIRTFPEYISLRKDITLNDRFIFERLLPTEPHTHTHLINRASPTFPPTSKKTSLQQASWAWNKEIQREWSASAQTAPFRHLRVPPGCVQIHWLSGLGQNWRFAAIFRMSHIMVEDYNRGNQNYRTFNFTFYFPSGEYELIDQLKQVHTLAITPCMDRTDLVHWTRGILRQTIFTTAKSGFKNLRRLYSTLKLAII